jgi:hypothetical protein
LSGKSYCQDNERGKDGAFRIYFENLIDLAADARPIEQVFCVGSVPPPTDSVWGHIEAKTGKTPETFLRGAASGKEQAVDQALQVRMLRLGYDYDPPETIVLLSGDGSGHEEDVGFFADVKRLHGKGWKIKIVAWRKNCSRVMREWAEYNGAFVDLGPFYSQVTFIEKLGRKASPLNLADRPRQ